jgi:hypothetical protein
MDAPNKSRPESSAPNDGRLVLPARNARQGVTGHNVRYVLGFSLAAVILAFVIIYLLFFGPHFGA